MPGLFLFIWFFAPLRGAVPNLQIESPPELAVIRARLQAIPSSRFDDISEFLGAESGSPIRVVLAPENTELARSVAPWISGFAVGESSLVVIFPARSPGYPDDTIEDVLRHEVAHVLIWRASDGHPLPRWFNEGLAMNVERGRRFHDQTELLYQLVKGGETDLHRLDALFTGSQTDQARAYALAGAFVHDVLQMYGATSAKAILSRIHQGASFEEAFLDVTGVSPATAESQFWSRQRIWTSWIPVLTSSTIVWLAITFLALLAIYMRRVRNREIEKRWEQEDESDSEDHFL
jgi:hypothetical protein